MTCLMMTSLGVYVLGAAEPEERRKVEAHLPHCQACRAELLRLAPIPGLLAMVPPEAPTRQQPDVAVAAGRPDDSSQSAPPRLRRTERNKPGDRRRSGRLFGSLAGLAAAGAAAAFLITGVWGESSHGRGAEPVTLSGTNSVSHVHARARLLATSWGTSIRLTIRGVPLNVRCRLVVRSRSGGTETTGLWEAWREGPITVPASAAWRPSDIASLAVMAGPRMLVTIKSGPPGTAGSPASAGR